MTDNGPLDRDGDLEEELRTHLTLSVQEKIAAGMSPAEADAEARREFGNLGQVKEVTREMRRGMRWDRFRQDLRFTLRMLGRTPGLAIVGVLTLALGIGANTAIFSVVRSVLLKPLPYPKSEQLIYITSQFPGLGFDQFPMDAAEFVEFRQRNKSFQSVGAYSTGAVNVGAADHSGRVTSARASASLFTTLEITPEQGRTFLPEETIPGAAPVAVISDELWRSTLGQRPIINQTIDVDGVPTKIIGVMPAQFDVHDVGVRIWLPMRVDTLNLKQYRGGHGYFLIGRLKNDVALPQARIELEHMLEQWLVLDGGTPTPAGAPNPIHAPNTKLHRLRFDELRSDMIGSAGRALWVLQAAVALVLLIACANLANLLLMRAETRQKELSVRLALGAGRGHLLRQFVTEGLVLSIAGAVVGIGLAEIALRTLVATYAGSIPRASTIHLDVAVLLFTLGLAVVTGVVFGLAPMLYIDRAGPASMLRESGTRTTAGVARRNVQRGLVIAEIAMAVTLVIGASLLVRSLWNLMNVDAGFQREQLITFRLSLPRATYADSMRRVVFFQTLTQRLAALPGVKDAAAMQGLPPLRSVNANDTQFENYTPTPTQPANNVDYWQWATPTYLRTIGAKIVKGRDFQPSDGPNSPPVVLINETIARLYYPGQDPIGRRIMPGGATQWCTVVGVVKDVKQGGVDSKTGTELYIDYEQAPAIFGSAPNNMNVVVRTTLPPAALGPQIRATVAALDPALPVDQLQSMDDVFAESVSRPRFLAVLLGVFGLVALLLAAIGTYGVLAYSVTQRRREIGIRMALGAQVGEVLTMIIGQGFRLAGIGIVVGLVGAVALTRVARSLLFGVGATDPLTYGAVTLVMVAVVTAACLVPAQRASRVDPIVTLRAD